MEIKDKDFVAVEFDIYANGNLVQTTDEKKAKEAGLNIKEFGPLTIIVGRSFLFKGLDDHIIKNKQDKEHIVDFKPEDAYGKRQKEMIRTFPKSAFDENEMRAVPGVTYDFNGMYGTVKSVTGGRVLVDFNNPLAGKDIKVRYKVVKMIENIKQKIETVFSAILRLPPEMYKVEVKEKEVVLHVPDQLVVMKDMLLKSLEEYVSEVKDYTVKIESFKKK